MILHVCVLYDRTEGFTSPGDVIIDRSKKEICRRFLQVFKRNPLLLEADWELRHIADFDEQTSRTVAIDPPQVLEPLKVLGLIDHPEPGTEQVE